MLLSFYESILAKIQKVGINKIQKYENAKILVFSSKSYSLILDDNKSTYINKIFGIVNSLGGEYNNFLKYI